MLTDFDKQVLQLDLNHLDDAQIKWLHDLKAEAFKMSLERDFQAMKQQRMMITHG